MSFNQLLKQTISLENPSGTLSKTGQPGFSAAISLSARVQKTHKSIPTKDRDRTPVHAIIFIGPATEPEIDAKITYDSTAYRVLAVEDVIGRNGSTHHYEIMAQLWSYES